MKKGYNVAKRLWLGIFVFMLSSVSAFAQYGNAGEILRSGKQDANIILKEYFKPIGQGFGANLNSGWFNTAKVHSLLGFDVTVNAGIAMVPKTDQLFNIQNLNLQNIEYISNGPETPTVVGQKRIGARIGSSQTYTDPETGQEKRLFEFDLPEGSGYPYIPAPMVQASVGLIKSTDLTVRFLPTVSMSNTEVQLMGVGVKHEINQWIPGGKLLPVDLSLQAGFTRFSLTSDYNVQPKVDKDTENPYPASTWEGQQAKFRTNAFAVNALVGKTLPMISVYGGVGYQASIVEISTPGSYPVVVPNENFNSNDYPNSKPKIVEKIDQPLDLKYDNNGSFQALVGTRIKFTIFNVSASYTLSKYPIAQVGVGIGIR